MLLASLPEYVLCWPRVHFVSMSRSFRGDDESRHNNRLMPDKGSDPTGTASYQKYMTVEDALKLTR